MSPQHMARPHHRREALGPAPRRDPTADAARFGFHLISEAVVSRCYTRESKKPRGLHARPTALSTGARWPDTRLLRALRVLRPGRPEPPSHSSCPLPPPAKPPRTPHPVPTATLQEGGLGVSMSLESQGARTGCQVQRAWLTSFRMASHASSAGLGPHLPARGSARCREWVLSISAIK